MRFVRYRPLSSNSCKPGFLDEKDRLLDLSKHVSDIDGTLLSKYPEFIKTIDIENLVEIGEPFVFGCPIAQIGKIIGAGYNYKEHILECKVAAPPEPSLFLKPASSLCDPDADLIRPRGASRVDWEIELGVVIGRHGQYIDEAKAMSHVGGYCVGIDFSERDFQFNRGGQGFKGKSADTFCPLGPWLVTADAVADPHRLELRLDVNGKPRQRGNTSDMIFSIPRLISYVSEFMSLHPGDVILTGTPAGVGMSQEPPVYLLAGDEVEASIEGLGQQKHFVRDFTQS